MSQPTSSAPPYFAPQTSLRASRPLHVALVPDGNGRWATARGLPRSEGHRAGVRAVQNAVAAALRLGIGTLTVHAFSADNWKRPPAEVDGILRAIAAFLDAERPRCIAHGVRVTVIGRRDRLPAETVRAIERSEHATAGLRALHLRLAVDYSARGAIADAAAHAGSLGETAISRLLAADQPRGRRVADVDLLVRTGGETRLSDFLLWECAYAELIFTATPWPDFGADHLAAALREFHGRERRFGGLSEARSLVTDAG